MQTRLTTPVARALSVLAVFLLAIRGTAYAQQMIGPCAVLPADNIWNTPVDTLPVLPNSATLVNTIGAGRNFHADFGSGTWEGGPIGIPFVTVSGSQAKYPAAFLYSSESDPGPYAVPLTAPIEGGSSSAGDRHVMAVDVDNCILYELYRGFPRTASWDADSGAIFNLRSNALRPATWTSADAAGLPITPGLVTYEEVASGEIRHAIRFTAPQTRREFVWPARHYASSLTGSQYPRMGERLRLKASFDVSPFPPEVQVILRAMKKYGIMLADNGSAWFISGKPDSRWNNDNLRALHSLLGSNFEAVDATVLRVNPNSGATTRQASVAVSVSPSSTTIRAKQSRAFTATVTGAPNTVTWSVNNIGGGDGTVGVIDPTGYYFAPSNVPNPATVTIRATSTASPSTSGTATVTIIPQPSISSVSPQVIGVGNFNLTIDGEGFTAGSVVSFDGASLPTAVVSSTRVTATGAAPTAKANVPVQVLTTDGEGSNTVFVTVAAISVSISPGSVNVRLGQSRQFTATVQHASDTSVIWKVNGIAGGNSIVGTVSGSGLYRAPLSMPKPGNVTVSATSLADPTKAASASVKLTKR